MAVSRALSRAALLALGVALLVTCGVQGQKAAILAKDISDAVAGDNGYFYILHEGVKHMIYDDVKSARPYFVNTETQATTWSDPRIAAPKAADINITVSSKGRSGTSKATLLAVALVPMLLIAGVMAGRIYYLSTYFPDLLWPSKERKLRLRSNQKVKAQKARGKMSQDGKGGRSANS